MAIREFYSHARPILDDELLEFTARDRDVIVQSFGETILWERYTCYAMEIMRDHVHLCIRKHRQLAEQMILTFQEFSRRALISAGLRDSSHPVWGGPGWKVFLDEPDDVWRTIRYIAGNPVKQGRKPSSYSFITHYDNFPFHKSSQNRQQ